MTLNLFKVKDAFGFLPPNMNGVDGYLNWSRKPILELKCFNQDQTIRHIELDYDDETIYVSDFMDGWCRLNQN